MMSARHWKERRNFWQTLIFWAWLSSFLFGFAGSDLFHTANCPDQLELRASNHISTIAHFPASHAFQFDVDCSSSLLQLSAHGIVVLALVLSVAFVAVLTFTRPRSSHAVARALIIGARGPPVSFI